MVIITITLNVITGKNQPQLDFDIKSNSVCCYAIISLLILQLRIIALLMSVCVSMTHCLFFDRLQVTAEVVDELAYGSQLLRC